MHSIAKLRPLQHAMTAYDNMKKELQAEATTARRRAGNTKPCFLPSFWLTVFGVIWPKKPILREWVLRQTGAHQHMLIHTTVLASMAREVSAVGGFEPSLPSSGLLRSVPKSGGKGVSAAPPAKFRKVD